MVRVSISGRFMVGTAGSVADRWALFLQGKAQIETWCPRSWTTWKIPAEQSACFLAALATYFLARRQEELLTPLAVTLNEAASSARVSLLTYQTVIGVRYHELVKKSAGEVPLRTLPVWPISQKIFFLAQPNERLSIVGHLDKSAIKIKKMHPATYQPKEEHSYRFFGMLQNQMHTLSKTSEW